MNARAAAQCDHERHKKSVCGVQAGIWRSQSVTLLSATKQSGLDSR